MSRLDIQSFSHSGVFSRSQSLSELLHVTFTAALHKQLWVSAWCKLKGNTMGSNSLTIADSLVRHVVLTGISVHDPIAWCTRSETSLFSSPYQGASNGPWNLAELCQCPNK